MCFVEFMIFASPYFDHDAFTRTGCPCHRLSGCSVTIIRVTV